MVWCTYRATNNEQSFLFLLNPSNNLIGALGESVAIRIGSRNAVELKNGSHPGERAGRSRGTMMYLDVRVPGMDAVVEDVVGRDQSENLEQ